MKVDKGKIVDFPEEEIVMKPFDPDTDLPGFLYFDDKTGKYYKEPQTEK